MLKLSLFSLLLISISQASLPDFSSPSFKMVKFSLSQKLAATVGRNGGELLIWDLKQKKRLFTVDQRKSEATFLKFNLSDDKLVVGTKEGRAFVVDLKSRKVGMLPSVGMGKHTAIEIDERSIKSENGQKTHYSSLYLGDEQGNVVLYFKDSQTEQYQPTVLHNYQGFHKNIIKRVEKIQVSDDGRKVLAYFSSFREIFGFGVTPMSSPHPSEIYQGPMREIGFQNKIKNPIRLKQESTIDDTTLGIQKMAVWEVDLEKGEITPIIDSADKAQQLAHKIHNFSSFAHDDNFQHFAFSLERNNLDEKVTYLFDKKQNETLELKGVFGNFLSLSDDGSLLAVAPIQTDENGFARIKIYDVTRVENRVVLDNPRPILTIPVDEGIRYVRFIRLNDSSRASSLKFLFITESGVIHTWAYSVDKNAPQNKMSFSPYSMLETHAKLPRNIRVHPNSQAIRFDSVVENKIVRRSINYKELNHCNTGWFKL